MHILRRNFFRALLLRRSLASSNANLYAESIKADKEKENFTHKEPYEYHKRTQFDADIKGNKFTVGYHTSAKMNFDLWAIVIEFLQTISHRNQLKEAKARVAELTRNFHSAEDSLGVESLTEHYTENAKVTTQLQKLTKRGNTEKTNTEINKLIEAVNYSYEQEEMHYRFLRSLIFIGMIVTFLLTSCVYYIYTWSLRRDIKTKSEEIIDLKKVLFGELETKNKEPWGSSIKGYVRPLYSWALPKK